VDPILEQADVDLVPWQTCNNQLRHVIRISIDGHRRAGALFADERPARLELSIRNEGTGGEEHGNYEATLQERRGAKGPSCQANHVRHFERALAAWALVKEVLNRMR